MTIRIIASIIAFLTSLSLFWLFIRNRKTFHLFSFFAALSLSAILICESILGDHFSPVVVKDWYLLNQMEFKRVKSKLEISKASEGKAVVVMNSKISTAGGDAEQKEVYFLILVEGNEISRMFF